MQNAKLSEIGVLSISVIAREGTRAKQERLVWATHSPAAQKTVIRPN